MKADLSGLENNDRKWLDSKQFCLADFDIDVEGEQIWVALCKGKPVGFISIWEPENFIHHLYISPEYTRKGIGARLLSLLNVHWVKFKVYAAK